MLLTIEQENINLKVENATLKASGTQQKKKVKMQIIIDLYNVDYKFSLNKNITSNITYVTFRYQL